MPAATRPRSWRRTVASNEVAKRPPRTGSGRSSAESPCGRSGSVESSSARIHEYEVVPTGRRRGSATARPTFGSADGAFEAPWTCFLKLPILPVRQLTFHRWPRQFPGIFRWAARPATPVRRSAGPCAAGGRIAFATSTQVIFWQRFFGSIVASVADDAKKWASLHQAAAVRHRAAPGAFPPGDVRDGNSQVRGRFIVSSPRLHEPEDHADVADSLIGQRRRETGQEIPVAAQVRAYTGGQRHAGMLTVAKGVLTTVETYQVKSPNSGTS